DKAATLTVWKRYASALKELEGSSDSLRMGIVACYAEQYSRAAELLRCKVDNPYLEWFQLYYLAMSLRKLDRYRESALELDSLFMCGDRVRIWGGGNSYASARELQLDVFMRDDSLFAIMGVPKDISSRSSREILIIADALADRGQDSIAVALFVSAADYLSKEIETGILDKLYGLSESRYQRLSAPDLRALAKWALGKGMNERAEKIVKELVDRDGGDPETLLIKGRLLESMGKRHEALDLYNGIAASADSSRIKVIALGACAAIEYKLGNEERAVEIYRTLASTYGLPTLLSVAARIDVALGRYEDALNLLASCGGRQSLWRASLLHWLARDEEAYDVLMSNYREYYRYNNDPDALFWRARTSPSDSDRVKWSSLLSEEYPNSYRTFALSRNIDSLVGTPSPGAFRSRLGSMVTDEEKLIDSLQAAFRQDSASSQHPGVKACEYLMERGLLAEAGQCVATLRKRYEIDVRQAIELYLYARVRGFYGVAIWIVGGSYSGSLSGDLLERLQHPVAFAGIIAQEEGMEGLSPELILAVMYAESKFSSTAVSREGASGVMQLMPSTARWVARKHGIAGGCADNLFDAECNIRIGAQYLSYLLKRCNGSVVGALAAYNAGDARMARWKQTFDPALDPMTAIEMIGPEETREYVREVLEALCFYRTLGVEREKRP
ncbi:MAG: lytic transglycosylase domain-containing protein, partial [Candidatus Krumholzibacteria bacterium]|nr:lytic transglycosylase domain-containing protein [Candidatus Krumholzibacteria bacterium]